jgi:hypothetical protein
MHNANDMCHFIFFTFTDLNLIRGGQPMKTFIRNHLFFLLCLFLLPFNTLAADPVSINATAEGVAVIVDNNTALARDQAVKDALRMVVEQTVGTMISSETVVESYEVLQDQIYSKTQGYIRNYNIINESPDGNLYRVTIQANVAKGVLKNDLMALGLLIARKNMPRIMIMVAEQNVGMHNYSYWWHGVAGYADLTITENTLMEKLSEKGFNIVDHTVKTKNIQISDAYKIESLTNDAIKTIGNLYDAEVVIYGKALSKLAGSVMGSSMKSAQADVSLRAVNTDNGQVIASSTNHAAAVHPSEVNAGTEALKLATEGIAEKLITQIINRWSQDVSGGTMIQVVISGIKSYNHLVKFKEMVQKKIRGVAGLYQRDFSSGVATLDINISTTAQNLADELIVIDYGGFVIDITSITQNSINLEMKMQ